MFRIFILLLVFGVPCLKAEQKFLAGTSSPDKKTIIVEERAENGERDYYLCDRSSLRNVGFVLPEEQRGQISNVAIIASWNRSSSKVALVVFYGTKLSELLLFAKNPAGNFDQVDLSEPDPIELYQKQTHKIIPEPGDGASVNGVGPWLDENTVSIVSGDAKQTTAPDRYAYIFATFKAHIDGKNANISGIHLVGPLSDKAGKAFIRKWGDRFFNAHD